MKTIWNGIYKENPIFVLLLGLCPALAVTTNFESAYLMGLSVLFVLLVSNFLLSLFRKWIPKSVRTPVSILVIATMVTILEIILMRHVPKVYASFGIYLPLIVVNCIVLGRALHVAAHEKVSKSICDAIGIGLGYTIALMVLGAIREILGNNTITVMDSISSLTGYRVVYRIFPTSEGFPISFVLSPAGAFLIMGLVLGMINWLRGRRNVYESH